MVNLSKLHIRLNSSIASGQQNSSRKHIPHYYVMSDMERLPKPDVILPCLPSGGAIIVRHPNRAELTRLAQRLVPRAHALGLKVLIAGDVRLAMKTKADGLHMSEQMTRHHQKRISGLPPNFLITAAAHNPRAIRYAQRAGADAILLSPVFPTHSHPAATALGIMQFTKLAHESPIPIIALGGITFKTVRRLQGSKIHGVAAIGLWSCVS